LAVIVLLTRSHFCKQAKPQAFFKTAATIPIEVSVLEFKVLVHTQGQNAFAINNLLSDGWPLMEVLAVLPGCVSTGGNVHCNEKLLGEVHYCFSREVK
jgi:hypothetical protein